MEETIARLTAEFWRERSQASSSSQRRRKKRKKRKLPRCGRARRRHRQWHVPGWFSGFGASHAVFPSSVGRPELSGEGLFYVRCWFCRLRCTSGYVSFLLSPGSRCSASWPVYTKRTVMRSSFPAVACARLVLQVFCTSRCVPLVVFVGRPAARSASWPLWTRRTRTQLVGFSLGPLVSGRHLFYLVLA